MKTILAGLFAVLVLASLLIATIQTENIALSPGAAASPGLVNLTADSPANDQNPAWSPDGAGSPPPRIAFESVRSGNLDIWVVDAPCIAFGDLDGDGDIDIADIMLGASPPQGLRTSSPWPSLQSPGWG